MEKVYVNFLNVTMDICYEIIFYFAKHKDKSIKNNLENEFTHMKLSSENFYYSRNHYMLRSYRMTAYKFYYIYDPVHDKTYKMTCTRRPGHPPSLIRVFAVHVKKACHWVLGYPLSAQRRLIRLRGSPGWSESLLGAQVILLVLSCNGSYISDVRKKLVFGVCDQLRLKPACSATETSLFLDISAIASRGTCLILSKQRTTKALIRLCRCACWSSVRN